MEDNNQSEENDTLAPVLIYRATDNEEALVVKATLESEGIMVYLSGADTDAVMGDLRTQSLEIFVAPSQVEAARSILTDIDSSDSTSDDQANDDDESN